MPDDLKYLAVIESSLDSRAVSPARAAGLWQFMPSTAPGYGLEVSAEVDERYHIEKSTAAASKYLKDVPSRLFFCLISLIFDSICPSSLAVIIHIILSPNQLYHINVL